MKEIKHDCQRFREDWAGGPPEPPIPDCDECRRFCEEASAITQLAAEFAETNPEPPAEYWAAFQERLQEGLRHTRPDSSPWAWVGLAAAAALAVTLTWGGLRLAPNGASRSVPPVPVRIEFVNDHIQGLNPEVVEFLGQSELFMRSFVRIQPSYTEEVEDARDRARRVLAEIEDQRRAVADFAPVRIALEEYEGVLREIKNLETSGDLVEIQNRVDRNGLIASLKAYQPRAVLVGQW
jgi:hypothetical protein